MVDDETQTLEEGRSDQTTPSRVLITKNGKAAHCRNDCPLLLKSYSIQSLSWCSHCDPSNVLEKRTWSGALGHENKFKFQNEVLNCRVFVSVFSLIS